MLKSNFFNKSKKKKKFKEGIEIFETIFSRLFWNIYTSLDYFTDTTYQFN